MSINAVAPGIYSEVIDLSNYTDTVQSTIGFVAIISEKGPDNVMTRVTPSTFYSLFGEPNLNYTNNANYCYGPYVASSFLSESSNLYVVRCTPTNAKYANLSITCGAVDLDNTTTEAIVCDTTSVDDMTSLVAIETAISDLSADNTTGYTLATFYGIGRGEYYNNYQIDLNKHPDPTYIDSSTGYGIYLLDVYQKQSNSTRFSSDSTATESAYVDYARVESFEVSFDPEATDYAGNSVYIEDVINTYSTHLKCVANSNVLKEISRRQQLDSTAGEITIDFSNGFIKSYTSSTTLGYGVQVEYGSSGSLFGSTGLNSTDDGTTVGSASYVLAKAYAGTLVSPIDGTSYVDQVLDTENYQIDLIFDAGYPKAVKNSIVSLANTRRDCLAIIDNGDNKTAAAALEDRTAGAGNTFAYNSPYVSVYEPYAKIYDTFTGKYIWAPPSYFVSRLFAYTDNNYEVWYPVAGFNRATITDILDLRYNAALGDRESFIKNQINPIVKFSEGYTLFSQRTALRQTTSRQDINVVRVINYVDKVLRATCRKYVFELNDSNETWGAISDDVTSILKEIKTRRGLTNYSVTVGATDYDIKMRRLKVSVTLYPMRAIEQIHLSFYIK